MLEFKDLLCFLAVYEEGSFTGAAKRLGTVQSAVSDRVQKLERVVGAPLFLRYHRSIGCTPSGERLYGHARRIMMEVGALQNAFSKEPAGLRR